MARIPGTISATVCMMVAQFADGGISQQDLGCKSTSNPGLRQENLKSLNPLK